MKHGSSTTQAFKVPSKLNSTIVAAQLTAIGSCIYASAHVHTWWSLILLSLVFGVVMNSVYSIVHEAEHVMLFNGRLLNDVVGSVMALFFPAPFHLIRQGHLGHHLRNRSDDEAFDFYFEEDHKLWKILVWYGILTGLYWVIVVLSNLVFLFFPFALNQKYWQVDQASTAFMKSLNPHYRRIIQLECAAAITLHVAVVWLFQIPIMNYLVMYAGFGFMWSAMQYVHHYGTERHVIRGARNLWIWGPLDLLWLNHNLHLAHHQHPSVPWVHLTGIGKAESSHRGFLILAYFKMWRGPRLAKERIENKHAETIIP